MLAFVVSIAIGLIVGILSGMLGIGGGMIMIPVFRLGYGMAAIQATATSLFTIIPTSLAGCVTHIRNKTCIPAIGIAAGLGGACASPLGVYLASASPSWAIMVAAAAIIAYSAVTMFRKALAVPSNDRAARRNGGKGPKTQNSAESQGSLGLSKQDASQSPELEGRRNSISAKKAVIATLVGIVAGVASGYVGVGGGFIMVPMFISVLGVGMKKASGTSLIAVSILAIPGVIGQLLIGNVIVGAGIAMAIGSVPGAILGARLAKSIPERQLRFLFSGLLVFAAVLLVVKELGI